MLNEIARSLGAFTRSPIQTAIDQAHRQARLLQTGGAVLANGADNGYVVPIDIEPSVMASAIEGKLCNRRHRPERMSDIPAVLQVAEGGRIAVRSDVVQRLGGGDADRGRRILVDRR